MKTLIASDIHGNLDVLTALIEKATESRVEVLVLGGDILSGAHPRFQAEPTQITLGFIEVFYELLNKLEIPIYMTPGNHDTYPFNLWKGRDHINVVIDDWVTIGSSIVYFTPWSLSFNEWAWMQEDSILEYNIPDVVTVVVSHGPMYGYYDRVDLSHVGSKTLLRKIQESSNIQKVFTGHIHGYLSDPEQMIMKNNNNNDVIVKNISLLDEDYKFKNKFIMEEL